jgi:hypothetical protein
MYEVPLSSATSLSDAPRHIAVSSALYLTSNLDELLFRTVSTMSKSVCEL